MSTLETVQYRLLEKIFHIYYLGKYSLSKYNKNDIDEN